LLRSGSLNASQKITVHRESDIKKSKATGRNAYLHYFKRSRVKWRKLLLCSSTVPKLFITSSSYNRKISSMTRSFYLITIVSSVFSALQPTLATQPDCNIEIYGVPNYADCVHAFSQIPYALHERSSYYARSYQLYAEPQYMHSPFGAVSNRYRPRPINQLPKIWRYGMLLDFVVPNHQSIG